MDKKQATGAVASEEKKVLGDAHITKLPFSGAAFDDKKRKALPAIEKQTYLKLNTSFDNSFEQHNNLKAFRSFEHRLPNIANYEVYYTSVNCDRLVNQNFAEMCSNFGSAHCGFLIFYDATNKEAQLVNVSNSYYMDSGIDMNFVIGEDYKIQLHETETTDGDEEEEESYDLSKHSIEIDANGLISIKEITIE